MIQIQTLNHILATGDSSLIVLNNLDKTFFSDYEKEFTYIKEHLDQYGKIPDQVTFLTKFPNFDIVEVKESDKYLIDELYKDKNMRKLASTFNSVKTLLNDKRVDEAMALYLKASEDMSQSMHMECIDILRDTSRYDAYIERSNDFAKYYVRTGFRELDDVIGGWDRQEELATIIARPNVGKCLAKGTEVLMGDGTIKKIEDIQVGDQVQSINGINSVLGLHHGKAKGYRIIPNVGEPFIVSADHILTLYKKDRKQVKNKVIKINSIEDIKIEDYLSLSQYQKNKYRVYRAPINYTTKKQKIPPYILGLWLGDGNQQCCELCTADSELKDIWAEWGTSLNLKVKTYHFDNSKAYSYNLNTGVKGLKNPALELLKEYNLINNKHIPLEYLTGDKSQRLLLLAGLIDTDGYYDGYNYSITSKYKLLADQYAQLARGLGFKTAIREMNIKAGEIRKPYYEVRFTGDLSQIPVVLTRKQHLKNKSDRNSLTTGFHIEELNEIEYYGFMCNGDHRFLLADNTVTHNSWILLKVAMAAAEQGLTVGLYSGEMSERKVGYRIDTLYGHLPNTALIHGNREIQNEYKNFLEDLANVPGKIKVITPSMIGGTAGVTALRAFIDKENLDILCIDQHSLLEDDQNAKDPVTKAANISRDLKKLQVMKKIPIIAVSQANRSIGEDGKLGLENIAQSDRIGQDSTVVIGIDKKDNILSLHLLKSRDSVNNKTLKYMVDLNRGLFEFIPFEDDARHGEGSEELRDRYEDTYEPGEDQF